MADKFERTSGSNNESQCDRYGHHYVEVSSEDCSEQKEEREPETRWSGDDDNGTLHETGRTEVYKVKVTGKRINYECSRCGDTTTRLEDVSESRTFSRLEGSQW